MEPQKSQMINKAGAAAAAAAAAVVITQMAKVARTVVLKILKGRWGM
jgi:hypothetical protein